MQKRIIIFVTKCIAACIVGALVGFMVHTLPAPSQTPEIVSDNNSLPLEITSISADGLSPVCTVSISTVKEVAHSKYEYVG